LYPSIDIATTTRINTSIDEKIDYQKDHTKGERAFYCVNSDRIVPKGCLGEMAVQGRLSLQRMLGSMMEECIAT
jgi:hypothetical protein